MTPEQEAAQILIRLLDTIVAPMGKRLGEQHKDEIRRACALLSVDGTMEPLDDLPRVSPAEAMIEAAQADPKFQEWRETKRRTR